MICGNFIVCVGVICVVGMMKCCGCRVVMWVCCCCCVMFCVVSVWVELFLIGLFVCIFVW